jgi:Ca2+-binding RTX toxin-like protein
MNRILIAAFAMASLAACDNVMPKKAPEAAAPEAAAPEVVDTPPAEVKANAISGTDGDDTLSGTDGADTIEGGGGNDRIQGLAGKDKLYGGTGNDVLNGGPGADVLVGGPGKDILIGAAGPDTLKGRAGKDVFRFTTGWGMDVVTDFAESDLLDFSRLSLQGAGETPDVAFAKLSITADDADTLIMITGDEANVVRLKGVAPSAVSVNSFRFE